MQPKNILILGHLYDEHAAAVQAELTARGHQALILDSGQFPANLRISIDPSTLSGKLHWPGNPPLALDKIHAVYWRGYGGVAMPELPDAEQAFIARNDARSLFESLLILLPTRWVNGWEAFQLHQTKPVQLARIASLHVPVPPTLLTNDPQEVRAFAAKHPRLIVKPVQGGDHTRRLSPEHLTHENLANLRYAPITLQAEVPGTNVRVFVAGQRVLACEVNTPAIDYREDAEAQLMIHPLPPPIEAMSRAIARELKMLWTGIDFRLTPDGQYVFLEANPSPMFLGFEAQTGLPLMETLIDVLTTD